MDAIDMHNDVPRFPLGEPKPKAQLRPPPSASTGNERTLLTQALELNELQDHEIAVLKLKVANQSLQLHMQGVAIARRNRRLKLAQERYSKLAAAAEQVCADYDGVTLAKPSLLVLAETLHPKRPEPTK
jgi:hypothetical protein